MDTKRGKKINKRVPSHQIINIKLKTPNHRWEKNNGYLTSRQEIAIHIMANGCQETA
jgi:hypothetical protein